MEEESRVHQRPTIHELNKKIKQAILAIKKQDRDFASIAKVYGELDALNIQTMKELWDLILILLEEISPEFYSGGRPPQRSYEKKIEGLELFAFTWKSHHLEQEMYLKFALDKGSYVYVSLHAHRPDLNERKLI